ncbi:MULTISPECIES: DUF397 domain-containing protein [unclassified Streptomyces]|uniref:DUF397 domain-containing protein n=1 Tax=unclassified Streptomyces TaxID=2593676 RepID=UPI002E0F6506|nr:MULTISPECIES: DUF397 domain-containing protein [unclassified Streptomyces]WSR26138.1 DUF397 domain-containing protein [Streptomyces sp. NBC_01205]
MQTPLPHGATWHKSSYSGSGGDCVEVATTADGGRAVRDSKDTTRPGFRCAAPAWADFVGGLKRTA